MSIEDKILRVNTVISALGLDKCKNTIIGAHSQNGLWTTLDLLIHGFVMLSDESQFSTQSYQVL